MTISSTASEISYAGNGATVAFAIPFPFDTSADIKVTSMVTATGDVSVLSSGFAITGGGGSTGTITFTTAPASTVSITVLDDPARTQPTDYVANDAFPAESHERALDRVTRLCKRLYQRSLRSLRVPDGDPVTDAELAPVSTRKGKYLFFDAITGAIDYAANIVTTTLSQGTIGALLYPRTAAEISAGVTPTNYAYPPGDVRRYGAVGDGTTDCTTAIQNAINTGHGVYIPNGTWKITAALDLPSYARIVFESRNAILKGALATAMIRGLNGTTTRTYGAQIWSGTLDNTSKATAGGVGIDWKSMTMAKCYGTIIQNVETGIKNGGSSSQGSFYNEFHGVDISSVVSGYDNGTLGNENKVFGGRVNDCTTGTTDNDNSCNSYFGLAIEVFTTGHRNSNTAASLSTRYYGSRLENAPSSGTAFSIAAAAQDTLVDWPYITGVSSTGLPSAGSAPNGLRTTVRYSELFSESGSTARKGIRKVTVTRDFASLAAGAFRQEGPITVSGANPGDAITCSLPSAFATNMMVGACLCSAADTVYVMIHNPSGGAVDQASLDYVFSIVDFT